MNAQKTEINWITFEQLEDSLHTNPKKVFISFNSDWCVYCKKMDRVTFKNKEIIKTLKSDYYAVRMNVESKDTIIFDGKKYINNQIENSRRPIHQIPLLLANRKNKPFSLPVNLILNKNFSIKHRFFEYLPPKKLISILK